MYPKVQSTCCVLTETSSVLSHKNKITQHYFSWPEINRQPVHGNPENIPKQLQQHWRSGGTILTSKISTMSFLCFFNPLDKKSPSDLLLFDSVSWDLAIGWLLKPLSGMGQSPSTFHLSLRSLPLVSQAWLRVCGGDGTPPGVRS